MLTISLLCVLAIIYCGALVFAGVCVERAQEKARVLQEYVKELETAQRMYAARYERVQAVAKAYVPKVTLRRDAP